MSPLISAQDLRSLLGGPDVRLIDASWRLGGTDMRPAFEAAHIPGAVFFDLDEISDRASPLPHMLPAPEAFAQAAGALGLSETNRIVVYDDGAFMSAPRVWWSFRIFGADRVQVLDGGLPAWKAGGGELESGAANPAPARFHARFRPELVRDYGQVLHVVNHGGAQIIDARPAERFRAEAPEPRPGIRGGHMPGARCLPIGDLYAPDGRMKDSDALRAEFAAAGADPSAPIISTCGSGVAAAAITLALAVLGRQDAAVYDGSWTEWGGRDDSPIVTGAA